MDLSPKPPRRFSRWQTTKRPFALGGAAHKPPSNLPDLQDDHNRSKASKVKARKVNDGTNDKIQNSLSNHSTDLVAKQTSRSLSSVKRSAVARQLYLNTSKRTENKNETTITVEVIQPAAQEHSNGDPTLHQNVSADKRDICLTTDSSLSNKLPKQNAREDIEAISNTSTHQNSKYALSSISQNASEIKSANMSSLLSQSKVHNSLNSVSWGAIATTDVLAREAAKRHRQAVEDEELSSTSSTDKENKEDKDQSNGSVLPSVVKKQKQDGSLHSLSISKSNSMLIKHINHTHNDTPLNEQNVGGEDLGVRMSTLRNRTLLASPEILLKKRQYPVFNSSHKSGQRKDLSREKDKSSTSGESSSNVEIDNPRVSPVSKIKLKQQNKIKTPPKKTSTHKHRSKNKGNSTNISGLESKKQNKSSHTNKSLNIFETSATNSFAMPKKKQDNCKDPNNTSSSSLRGGLRDRRSLPTPEEVQQKRQYPISFYLSSKKSSDKISFNSSREGVAKKKRKEKLDSTLDSTKSSVSSGRTSSKSTTHSPLPLDSSKNKIAHRNNSARSEMLTIDNHVSSKKHSQLTHKYNKRQHNSHVIETATEAAGVGKTSTKLQKRKYTVKKSKQTSLKHNLKSKYSPEIEDQELTASPSKKSSNSKHSFSSTAERYTEGYAATDVSVQISQLPAGVADTTWKQAQKIAQKRPPSRLKPTTNVNNVQTINTTLETVTRQKVSVSDVVVVSHKQHKTGKLEASASTTQSKLLLTGLSTDTRDVVSRSKSQKNKPVSAELKNKTGTTVKPRAASRMKDTDTSVSPGKLPRLKAKKNPLSLPRRPLTKPSNDEHSLDLSFEEDNTLVATVDVSAQLPQRSETSIGISHEKPHKAEHKRPSLESKINSKKSKGHSKLATSTNPDVQINESVLVSQKHPRKRKLLEEIDRAEEDTVASTDNQVFMWCPDGRRSDLTAYDVILQTMVDEEDKLLDGAEDGSIEHRTVKKVMSRLRHNIKPMIEKLRGIRNLKVDIREQKSRIKKLMEDIKEQQRIAQVNREHHSRRDSDKDVLMARYKDTMKRYSQLINRFVEKS